MKPNSETNLGVADLMSGEALYLVGIYHNIQSTNLCQSAAAFYIDNIYVRRMAEYIVMYR